MAWPPIVSATEWERPLASLAKQEEAVAVELDKLAAAGKRVPMVRVECDWRFERPHGEMSGICSTDAASSSFSDSSSKRASMAGPIQVRELLIVGRRVADLGTLHARDIPFANDSPRAAELDRPAGTAAPASVRLGWVLRGTNQDQRARRVVASAAEAPQALAAHPVQVLLAPSLVQRRTGSIIAVASTAALIGLHGHDASCSIV